MSPCHQLISKGRNRFSTLQSWWESRSLSYTPWRGRKKRSAFIKYCICYSPTLASSPEHSCHHLDRAIQPILQNSAYITLSDSQYNTSSDPQLLACSVPHNILYFSFPSLNCNNFIMPVIIPLITASEVSLHWSLWSSLWFTTIFWCPSTVSGVWLALVYCLNE